ncbi:MAG TPA: hypothetical protein VM263_12360 [Acidimicrobiales bacterium]|nr:hypothetical protein [Acidimicrobiales bacterium]
MNDREVIDAFLTGGAKRAFGPSLHIEGNSLILNGWWHAALRIADRVIVVRNEEPREDRAPLDELLAALGELGLAQVALDHPYIQPITYTELSLGQVSWALYAPDLATGEQALVDRASAETFFTDASSDSAFFDASGAPKEADFSAELGGARRVAGLPAALVLTVGVAPERAAELGAVLDDCRVVTKSFAELPPSACGSLIPGVVLVDASGRTGVEFIMELRAEACGRYVPVVALTETAEVPLGADAVLDLRQPPAAWAEPVRALLP